jgi:hypothetical protein
MNAETAQSISREHREIARIQVSPETEAAHLKVATSFAWLSFAYDALEVLKALIVEARREE